MTLDQTLDELALGIVEGRRTVFLTGAGLSVASGIPPFRGQDDAVWEQSVHSWGTREKFEEGALEWYNTFWLKHFDESKADGYLPNAGHEAIASICKQFPATTRVITQNVDRLHLHSSGAVSPSQLIEIHGFTGGFKCYTEECTYADKKVHFASLRDKIRVRADGASYLPAESDLPRCPSCKAVMVPNCLLFDEDYSDHDSYRFDEAKEWLDSADMVVFVGTSFAVHITNLAFCCAASHSPASKVYNFNVVENVPPVQAVRVDVRPVVGKCEDTLTQLAARVL